MLARNALAVFVPALFAATLTPALAQTQSSSAAQDSAQSDSSATQQPGYTFQANSRVVLTDVTVTDAKGNPVHSLPQSAFHLLDNKRPQVIRSFEEHTGPVPVAPIPAAEPGFYSNDYVQHLPPVLNIIVLDISNLEIPDQMYLSYELTKFLKEVPGKQPLAIYLRSGGSCILVQDFTSDRTLLLSALHRAIPRFLSSGHETLSDLDTMRQMAIYLGQLRGRKNVLWFSAGTSISLFPDAEILEKDAEWRELYDQLEQERIAVYPVDARGLTVTQSSRVIYAQFSQHIVMDNVARATGGQAFYYTNGIAESATQVLNTDGSFYTLTYSPSDFHVDKKWHNVRITLDGEPYHLSYRSGYFADGTVGDSKPPAKSRTSLMPGGVKVEVSPQLRSVPIIFEAIALPVSSPELSTLPPPSASTPPPPPTKRPGKGELRYSIRYSLPIDALNLQEIDGKKVITFGIAAIAFNSDGQTIAKKGERATMTLNQNSLSEHRNGRITIDQLVDLQRGEDYLYLAVWDVTSGRLGTLQVPITVAKPSKQ